MILSIGETLYGTYLLNKWDLSEDWQLNQNLINGANKTFFVVGTLGDTRAVHKISQTAWESSQMQAEKIHLERLRINDLERSLSQESSSKKALLSEFNHQKMMYNPYKRKAKREVDKAYDLLQSVRETLRKQKEKDLHFKKLYKIHTYTGP